MLLTIAAEDVLCEAVARRLVSDYLPDVDIREPALGLSGRDDLRRRIKSCNAIAEHIGPVFVVTDADRPDPCPPKLLANWVAGLYTSDRLLLRFAVMEVEAWILADRPGCADWLRISEAIVPRVPENEIDPKRRIVQLAGRSRSRRIRTAIVPQSGPGTNRVGPDYNTEVSRFVHEDWNPELARRNASSLERAIRRLGELAPGRTKGSD